MNTSSAQKLRTIEIEAEPQLSDAAFMHGVPQRSGPVRIEHEEPCSPRTDQLSSERAVMHPALVEVIDVRIGHQRRTFLLVLPVLVHQPAELVEVAALKRLEAPLAEILDIVEVVNH